MTPAGGSDPRAVAREWTIEDSCLLDLLRKSLREEEQSAPTYRIPIPMQRLRRFLVWGEMAAASESRTANAVARAEAAERRVGELEVALEPFADACGMYRWPEHDDDAPVGDDSGISLRLRNFRAAARALHREPRT